MSGGSPSSAIRRSTSTPASTFREPSSQPPFGTESMWPPIRSARSDAPRSVNHWFPASSTSSDRNPVELAPQPLARRCPRVRPGDPLGAVLVARQLPKLAQLGDRAIRLQRHGRTLIVRVIRRSTQLLGAACLLVAGGVAAVIVLVFSDSSTAASSKAEYFARVADICGFYGTQLSGIRPPADFAVPGEVAEPIRQALPLMLAETRGLRALTPPRELAARVEHWLALRDRAIAELKRTLHDANLPDIRLLGPDWLRFLDRNSDARRAAAAIGLPRGCSAAST